MIDKGVELYLKMNEDIKFGDLAESIQDKIRAIGVTNFEYKDIHGWQQARAFVPSVIYRLKPSRLDPDVTVTILTTDETIVEYLKKNTVPYRDLDGYIQNYLTEKVDPMVPIWFKTDIMEWRHRSLPLGPNGDYQPAIVYRLPDDYEIPKPDLFRAIPDAVRKNINPLIVGYNYADGQIRMTPYIYRNDKTGQVVPTTNGTRIESGADYVEYSLDVLHLV